jgi:hypothetical protein
MQFLWNLKVESKSIILLQNTPWWNMLF